MPAALERVVRRCLEKDPEERFQSARDLAFALEALAGTSATTSWASAGWSATECVAWSRRDRLGGSGGGRRLPVGDIPSGFDRETSSRPVRRLPARAGPQHRMPPRLSRWAFTGVPGLGRARLDLGCARSTRRRPDRFREQRAPGDWRGRRTRGGWPSSSGKVLQTIDLAGGAPVTVAEAAHPILGDWSPEGVILFTDVGRGAALFRVPAAGGEPARVTSPATGDSNLWPSFLPGGQTFLYQRARGRGANDARWRARRRGVPASADGPLPGRLCRERPRPVRQGTRSSGSAHGRENPSPEATGPSPWPRTCGSIRTWGVADFSASQNGVLAYRQQPVADRELVWLDRSGRTVGTLGAAGRWQDPDLSPDGGRLVVTSEDSPEASQLWIFDLVRGSSSRPAPEVANARSALWSRDGRHLYYASQEPDGTGIYRRLVDGTGSGDKLVSRPPRQRPLRRLARREVTGPGHVGRERAGRPVRPAPRRRPAAEAAGRKPVHGGLGPFLARRAVPRLCVRREHRRDGGIRPAVPADRRAMAGLRRRRRLPGVALGRPRALLPRGREAHGGGRPAGLRSSFVRQAAGPVRGAAHRGSPARSPYVVTPDGQRFLFVKELESRWKQPIVVVSDWLAGRAR